jgi:serine/threonine-protein kinase
MRALGAPRVTAQPGQQLGNYRLVEQIGEGGMGVVWRATDTTLNRDVAIKMLPQGFAGEVERMQRFEQEARLLASLNHPHIATIHGFHEDAGMHYLAMELVEGEDLSQRIAREAIPLERIVEIATQIAEALEVAHSQGVIHRDLKPANIKLTSTGQVKVLDFGLAKALSIDPASGSSTGDPAHSPTMTSAGTLAGMIIGTAAYMSPEQARGKSADRRADLWAFGCLLYEMLARKRTFDGETISDALASVLKEQPDWSALPEETPPAIRRLLRRCLTKDPRGRLGDAGAVRLELREALEPLPPGEQTAPAEAVPPLAPVRRRVLPWVVTAMAVVVAIAAMMIGGEPEPVETEPFHLAIPLPVDVKLNDDQQSTLAVSPDGRHVVVVGSRDEGTELYLRALDAPKMKAIPGTLYGDNPFFSPDGRWVGFFAEGKLKKVSIVDGALITICDSSGTPRGATWGDGDRIVFPTHFDGGLFVVNASGGEARPLTELDSERRERTHRWPSFIPGRGVVLFTVATLDSPEFYDDALIDAVDLSTGDRKTVYEGASLARYLPTGHLLLAREGLLFAVPFDADRLEVTGPPEPVVQEVMGARNSGVVYADVAQNGMLAYFAGKVTTRRAILTWRHFDGRSEPVAGAAVDGYVNPALSPDGKRIAVSIAADDGSFHIWIYDIERQTPTRLTFEGNNQKPCWTPDGKSIVFSSVRDGQGAVYVTSADGSGNERLVHVVEGVTTNPYDVSRDGRITMAIYGSNRSDIYSKSLDDLDGEAVEFSAGPAAELHGTLSPDGRWIAYTSDEMDTYDVFVRPFPGPGGRWQISKNGGIHPRWSPDGRRLFYRIGRKLYGVDIEVGKDGAFRPGTQQLLLDDLPRAQLATSYGLSLDGKAILVPEPADATGTPEQITVVVNWLDDMERLLAEK